VKLRRELIARNADGSDLRLRGQRASFEAVDADDRARSRHVVQLLLKDRGIVRERLDLLAGQRRAERRPARIGGRHLFVLTHRNRRLELRDLQHRDLLVVASTDADVRKDPRLESGKFSRDAVSARLEIGNRRDADVGRAHGGNGGPLVGVVDASDGDRRARNDRAARIDDGHAQRSRRRRLRERGRRGEQGSQGNREARLCHNRSFQKFHGWTDLPGRGFTRRREYRTRKKGRVFLTGSVDSSTIRVCSRTT
jgi:hypothetical protein